MSAHEWTRLDTRETLMLQSPWEISGIYSFSSSKLVKGWTVRPLSSQQLWFGGDIIVPFGFNSPLVRAGLKDSSLVYVCPARKTVFLRFKTGKSHISSRFKPQKLHF